MYRPPPPLLHPQAYMELPNVETVSSHTARGSSYAHLLHIRLHNICYAAWLRTDVLVLYEW